MLQVQVQVQVDRPPCDLRMDPHCWGVVDYREGGRLVGQDMGRCCLHHRSDQPSEDEVYAPIADFHTKAAFLLESREPVVAGDAGKDPVALVEVRERHSKGRGQEAQADHLEVARLEECVLEGHLVVVMEDSPEQQDEEGMKTVDLRQAQKGRQEECLVDLEDIPRSLVGEVL